MAKKYIKTHSIQFVDVFYSRKQERGQCGVCLVRHHNTANPHCHLVYNRVDNNGKTIWLERNVWRGNDDGIRWCQQFVINYEDSVRRRYEMEHEAAMRDSIGRQMIKQSEIIKRELQ